MPMPTEATPTGAEEFDLAQAFDEVDPENGTNLGESTDQPVIENDEVELDENGEPVEKGLTEVDSDLELELDENGDPIQKEVTGEIKDDHKVMLTVDGKQVEKTFGELKVAAQKVEAAEQRFREAANIRKEYEEKAAVLPEREKQLGQVLEYYINQANTLMQAEQPDWAKLLEEDPHGYLKERQKWETKQAELNQAKNIQMELQRQNAAALAASNARRAQEEMQKLSEALPEWKDPKKAAEGAKAVDAYLEQQGLPPEMRAQIDTATVFLIARKAMLYDQAVAKQAAARAASASGKTQNGTQQRQTQVVRPSAGKVVTPQAQRANQTQKANAARAFKAAPSVDTLAGFFE